MITILSKNSFQDGFKIEGHAQSAEHGRDIVCASVSVLSQTALLALLHYEACSYQMSNGFLDVDVTHHSRETYALMKALELGLQQIEDQYTGFVQIKEKGSFHV